MIYNRSVIYYFQAKFTRKDKIVLFEQNSNLVEFDNFLMKFIKNLACQTEFRVLKFLYVLNCSKQRYLAPYDDCAILSKKVATLK